jgi:hypothetical protein
MAMPAPTVPLDGYSLEFIRLAQTGSVADALDKLRGASMQQALYACNALDASTQDRLLKGCSDAAIDDRQRFALRVVTTLQMPKDRFAGISKASGDFHVARMFILDQLDRQQKTGSLSDNPFYPEYSGSRRDKMCAIARDHAGLDQGNQMQTTFFSLNGLFGWDKAKDATAIHTTCGLFIRACVIAAGYRGHKATSFKCGGIGEYIGWTSAPGAHISYADRGGRVPRPGDIFHIGGPHKVSYTDKDTGEVKTKTEYNDHVGVILSHTESDGVWVWETVEGGQGTGCRTEYFPARQVKGDDHARMMGYRALEGWLDLDVMNPWL